MADGLQPLTMGFVWEIPKTFSYFTLFFFFTARHSVGLALLNAVFLAVFVGTSLVLSRRMVPLARQGNNSRASFLERYADVLANLPTVRRLGVSVFVQKRTGEAAETNDRDIRALQRFHAARWFLLHTLFGAAFLSTIGVFLFQISRGQLSPSILVLFIAAYVAVRAHIERLSEYAKFLMEMGAYIKGLEEVVDEPTTSVEHKSSPSSWEEIFCEGITFHHPGNTNRIRVPFFRLRRGEIVNISGPSGEGKTTFLHLLANFFKPEDGQIGMDGTPYEKMSPLWFQNQTIFLSQEVEFFNVTLRENLCLGKEVEEKRLWKFLEEVHLEEWVGHLADGLETVVGEKGIKLSAGQKQRVNLLRGVILERDILFLDEPTSHLDVGTEQVVVEFLRRHLQGRTAVIVSHREALRALCSRSYVMGGHILKEKVG